MMAQDSSRRLTEKLIALLEPRDIVELIGPALSVTDLADPDRNVDAAMDHWIPSGASPEMLRQAQRCLLEYVAWLREEALPRHPCWAKDEVGRALRRLVELEAAVRAAEPTIH